MKPDLTSDAWLHPDAWRRMAANIARREDKLRKRRSQDMVVTGRSTKTLLAPLAFRKPKG